MNKKTTKLMATALTATMGAGIATQLVQAAEVTPYEAALEAVITMEKDPSGANIDKAYNAVVALKAGAQKDALNKRVEAVAAPHHKAVYDIMVTARTNKDLKTIGDARKAVAGMAKIFIKDAYTWSSELDNFTIEYQKTVVDTLNAIANGKKEVKQATINELREIIVGLELQRSNEGLLKLVLDYSATLDKVQMDYVNVVLAEVKAAKTTEELNVAKAKYNDLLTMKDVALKEAVQSNIGAVIADKEVEFATPKVAGVTVLNGGQLLVTFNQKVDATTATTLGNYTLSDGKTVSSATVQADSKSVKLTLSAAFDNTAAHKVAVTVENIKVAGTVDTMFPIYSQVITVEDKVKADVVSVTSETNGNEADEVTVRFTEPIQTGATFKVDGEFVSATYTAGSTAVKLAISEGLLVDKTHTLEVVNVKDMAGNVNSLITKTFTVSKDTSAPVVQTVQSYGDNKILVTFSKEMNAATIKDTTNVVVKNEALDDVEIEGIAELAGDVTGTKFVVSLKDKTLYDNKTSRNFTVLFRDKVITDYLGNKMDAATKTVTLSKDTVAPSVTNVQIEKNSAGEVTNVILTYNEEISAVDASKVVVVDNNGVLVTDLFTVAAASGNEVKLAVKAGVTSGQFNVQFQAGFAKDSALKANNSTAYSTSLNFGNSSSAGTFVLANDKATALDNVITVVFPEAVRGGSVSGSATDVNNYTLNGKPLPVGTTITLNESQTTATITLADESIAKTDTKAVFTINNVTTLSNKVIKPFTNTIDIKDNVSPILQSAKLSSYDASSKTYTFELAFNEGMKELTSADLNDELVVKVDGVEVALTTATGNKVDGFANKVSVVVVANNEINLKGAITITTKESASQELRDAAENAAKPGVAITVIK